MRENGKKKIFQHLINNNRTGNKRKIILKTGEAIYPDIINFDRKVVYEIHVKGERRGNYFDKLPNGWKGINVFYEEEDNPETLIVKFVTNEVQIIKWPGIERYANYKTAIKPHVEFLKAQIKNKGEMEISIKDLLEKIGITENINPYGLIYVLFLEGIILTVERTGVFKMRERVEDDTLHAKLITDEIN